jgi:formate--tetrahydrofolate ligase
MQNDLSIAQSVALQDINDVANRHFETTATSHWNKNERILEPYGHYKAKLPLSLIDKQALSDPKKKLILVSAMSPTPAGEGKTTISIGLTEALNQSGVRAIPVLREPSLGPVFGLKGGATGGGYAQVLPMEDINLHFTGDFSAIEKAHNLLAALIDNNLQSKTQSLDIDARTVQWRRVTDMNDRSLRHIVTGLGGTSSGVPRETGFDITAASEIMAILCLTSGIEDLKKRLGNIFIGFTFGKMPVYARDLNAEGAMAALLKDAIKPNLVQTIEGNPAIIHGGPFANIAQGTNSVLATQMGLSLSDYVVTEAGFGFDLGAEKFFDIKCRSANLSPSVVVLVATIRALKYHGGVPVHELTKPNPQAVQDGLQNLDKHVDNIKYFGVPAVVTLNVHSSDTEEEIRLVQKHYEASNISVIPARVWAEGGKGGLELAEKVKQIAEAGEASFTPLYDNSWSIEEKIKAVTGKIYGASAVDFTPKAKKDLETAKRLGMEQMPVCIAKTQKSLSDNPLLLGRPKDFLVTIRQIELAAGAGFIIPITGNIVRMPGLPATPAAEQVDIDSDGRISGLF